ncbi:hypothetical protein GCM10009069_07610 [Algimonas arctica]|uniref:Phosphoribosylpyrophosphate synthetase n=1 Tax=Algimonas arctica TaxID=1479486 RepID=A0A8J3G1K6_9PROT|nr:hypothetical protein [Algimonas arctica]GHA86843.1 hypothetical protein GCM10009069_07610 [Algimonas arctica]
MAKDIPELMEAAAARGFTLNFEMIEDDVICRKSGRVYTSETFTLIETLQKDAGTDPGDEATLFLLESENGDRGVLLIGNPAHLSPAERAVLERLDRT